MTKSEGQNRGAGLGELGEGIVEGRVDQETAGTARTHATANNSSKGQMGAVELACIVVSRSLAAKEKPQQRWRGSRSGPWDGTIHTRLHTVERERRGKESRKRDPARQRERRATYTYNCFWQTFTRTEEERRLQVLDCSLNGHIPPSVMRKQKAYGVRIALSLLSHATCT